MKIAFIGGGSVRWTAKLVADMALTETLNDAHLVLHDIDAAALDLLTRVCQKIITQLNSNIQISGTPDRAEALGGADFVIFCVAIGGLEAMRHDLEIPEKYGVYQAVGDTVGPGGLARGLRHIPFAIQVAREMEALCPAAWFLNLTNPMTTICRVVSRATSIRTIGLCHEVTNVTGILADLLNVPRSSVRFDVAGINHLPVILNLQVGQNDGMVLLRDWLAEHGSFAFADEHLSTIHDIFHDRLCVKFSLLENLGVLFGAGDRHVAEFFPGFLTEQNENGGHYGVVLTTIAHRTTLVEQRRGELEAFVKGKPQEWTKSTEQLADIMAALSGGPTGEFIVNVPNSGQIDNLPRDAVVECKASLDASGVRPLVTGPLPLAAYAAIAGHVARQELIVESAISGSIEPALAALTTDPLVHNLAIVKPMLDELTAANAQFMEAT